MNYLVRNIGGGPWQRNLNCWKLIEKSKLRAKLTRKGNSLEATSKKSFFFFNYELTIVLKHDSKVKV